MLLWGGTPAEVVGTHVVGVGIPVGEGGTLVVVERTPVVVVDTLQGSSFTGSLNLLLSQ